MMKTTRLWTVLIALTLLGCSMADDEESEVKERVSVGDRLPVFTVATVEADGTAGTFSTARLKGETVVVLFNTSCSDCRRELPRLNDYYLQHRNDRDFSMVAVSREEGAGSVAAFWKSQGLSLPYSAQEDRRVFELFATATIPRVYYATDGIVRRIFVEKE